MQSWCLQRKIQVTQTRIIEWYQHYNGQVYVSFSGGKDSTVLLDLARRAFPNIEAVFIDTGLEYPELRNFVKTFNNVTWIKPKINFKKVIESYGYPVISKSVSQRVEGARKGQRSCISLLEGTYSTNGKDLSMYNCPKWKFLLDSSFKISPQCCKIMKKDPAKEFLVQNNKYPIVGTMASESMQRKNAWLKTGCNSFNGKKQISQPMSFWTEQDVLSYIKLTDTSYCKEIYGDIIEIDGKLKMSNTDRTGCMFCMFGIQYDKEPNRFQRMKITHPQIYDYCMKSCDDGGLGIKDVLEYIGVKYE